MARFTRGVVDGRDIAVISRLALLPEARGTSLSRRLLYELYAFAASVLLTMLITARVVKLIESSG